LPDSLALDLKKCFIGVNDLRIDLFVDYSAEVMVDFVCGANQWDHHLSGCVWDGLWSICHPIGKYAQLQYRV
jgi:hypothetical protein